MADETPELSAIDILLREARAASEASSLLQKTMAARWFVPDQEVENVIARMRQDPEFRRKVLELLANG